jgi:hypothetical protein
VWGPPPPPATKKPKKENVAKSGFNRYVPLIGAVTTFMHAVTTMRIMKIFCILRLQKHFETIWNYKNGDNYNIREGNDFETFWNYKFSIALAINILKHSKNNSNCDDFKSHFEWLQHISCNGIQCVGVALENIVITPTATNSYNISDFKLQAL